MIRKLDRYILREMIVPFLIGTLAVVLMFQANLLIALFKSLNLANVPTLAILKLIALKTPYFLNMTLPVGIALASSLAISRLARESELTAMRSAGMPIRRVIRPVLFAGVVISLLNYWVVEFVMPRSEFSARKLANEINMLALAPDVRANVVLSIKNYSATIGLVTRSKNGDLMLNDILLVERRARGELVLITSDSGSYRQGNWSIERPYFRYMNGNSLLAVESKEKPLQLIEPISVPDLFQQPSNDEMRVKELLKVIDQRRKMKQDTRQQEVTLQTRFSVPAACLVFSLVGPVFAFGLRRSGPFVGVLLSLIMVLLYYNAFVISTEIVGRLGWAPPWVAAWLPDIVFFVFGLIALWRSE
ncbi:MAG: LptF/LptG family permease [Armatimonadetes bacterium]|nr:LptF/LptG family permease [Armatimonadota bacterium]